MMNVYSIKKIKINRKKIQCHLGQPMVCYKVLHFKKKTLYSINSIFNRSPIGISKSLKPTKNKSNRMHFSIKLKKMKQTWQAIDDIIGKGKRQSPQR